MRRAPPWSARPIRRASRAGRSSRRRATWLATQNPAVQGQTSAPHARPGGAGSRRSLMRSMTLGMSAAIFILALCALGGNARAADPHLNGLVGTTFPADFPRIIDASLGVPVIGFGGSQGRVERVPVIFLHGNNDTPFPTTCNPFGYIHNLAQFFLVAGHSPGVTLTREWMRQDHAFRRVRALGACCRKARDRQSMRSLIKLRDGKDVPAVRA